MSFRGDLFVDIDAKREYVYDLWMRFAKTKMWLHESVASKLDSAEAKTLNLLDAMRKHGNMTEAIEEYLSDPRNGPASLMDVISRASNSAKELAREYDKGPYARPDRQPHDPAEFAGDIPEHIWRSMNSELSSFGRSKNGNTMECI